MDVWQICAAVGSDTTFKNDRISFKRPSVDYVSFLAPRSGGESPHCSALGCTLRIVRYHSCHIWDDGDALAGDRCLILSCRGCGLSQPSFPLAVKVHISLSMLVHFHPVQLRSAK